MTPVDQPTSRQETTRDRAASIAVIMGMAITVAGIAHFASPEFFDEIVPPWLPPSERFWTYLSGAAELVIGPLLIWRRTRRPAALAAVALFILVYPANLYMAWDWRDRELSERIVSWIRLPFQFVFIWLAVVVVRGTPAPASRVPAPR
jgi:uncharacterized membrane protein